MNYNESFIKEFLPMCTELSNLETEAIVSNAMFDEVDNKIKAILGNSNYKQLLGPAGTATLNALDKKVVNHQVSKLATSIDHLKKVISDNLNKQDPQAAMAIATKIKNSELRDHILYTSLKTSFYDAPKDSVLTLKDFVAARQYAESIENDQFRNTACAEFLLPRLLQHYDESGDPAPLNEIFAVTKLINSDAVTVPELRKKHAELRENGFVNFSNLFAHREDLRASIVNGNVVVETIDPGKYQKVEKERLDSIRRLIVAFKNDKLPPASITPLIMKLPTSKEKYNTMRDLFFEYYTAGNKSAQEAVAPKLEELLHEFITDNLKEKRFSAALEMLPRVDKLKRTEGEKTILQAVDQEMTKLLDDGKTEKAELLLREMIRYEPKTGQKSQLFMESLEKWDLALHPLEDRIPSSEEESEDEGPSLFD